MNEEKNDLENIKLIRKAAEKYNKIDKKLLIRTENGFRTAVMAANFLIEMNPIYGKKIIIRDR